MDWERVSLSWPRKIAAGVGEGAKKADRRQGGGVLGGGVHRKVWDQQWYCSPYPKCLSGSVA